MLVQASAHPAIRRLVGTRRRQAILLVLAAVVAVLVALLVPAVQSQVRPAGADNVILIVPDDMRADELAAMPELGRLAERGISFSRAFVTTPLCCPSRASILTGRYARNHGVLRNSPPNGGFQAFDDHSTLATWLQAGGVRTGLVGRYLTGYQDTLYIPPGWDTWFGMFDSGDGYQRYHVNHNGERKYFGTKEEEYSTRVLTQESLRFLAEDRTRPFFLHVTPRAPHRPAREDVLDAGLFKDRELPLAPSYDEEDVDDKPRWVRELPRLDPATHEELEDFRRRTRGTLVSLDRGIAAIVEALRADGRLDRTWIMFMSDNGFMLGEHRITLTKSCPYEECVRVPFVVIPPGGLDRGRSDGRIVANIDLAPTIAAIVGATPDGPIDGLDLLPVLRDQARDWRDAVVLEHPATTDEDRRFYAVRTADWKYVTYLNGEEELYDLASDPYELTNLAADPARATEKADLAEKLSQLLGRAEVER